MKKKLWTLCHMQHSKIFESLSIYPKCKLATKCLSNSIFAVRTRLKYQMISSRRSTHNHRKFFWLRSLFIVPCILQIFDQIECLILCLKKKTIKLVKSMGHCFEFWQKSAHKNHYLRRSKRFGVVSSSCASEHFNLCSLYSLHAHQNEIDIKTNVTFYNHWLKSKKSENRDTSIFIVC